MKNLCFVLIVLFLSNILLSSCLKKELASPPVSLTVSEGLTNPLGFYDASPSFSWKLPVSENCKAQTAYQIVVASSPELLPDNADLWQSGKVDSDASIAIAYEGKPLKSRQKVYWQVAFFNQDEDESRWSEMAHFELGLLDNEEWKANWIQLEAENEPQLDRYDLVMYKPEYLRHTFKVKNKIAKARLYITSRGVFEAHLNGSKVGEDYMTPGYTPYSKRIETMTYDVTKQLQNGENALGIILGEGWYSGRLGWSKKMWNQKPLPQALCQLEVEYADGSTESIVTDNKWKGTRNGPIRYSGIYDGENYDANMEFRGWSEPYFDDSTWEMVQTEAVKSTPLLMPKSHRSVKQKKTLATTEVSSPQNGVYIFDLGQNTVGVPILNIPVVKDQKVTIRFAEMLNQDGTLYTENYRSAKSTNYYIPNKTGVVKWQPTFTFHGFRYVELSGVDATKTADKSWVTGVVYTSDYEQVGQFSSSHAKLNQLQSNIEWGMRSNFIDIPTDCPQRDERMGWTGDAQVFASTSLFIGNVHDFWAAWLQSVREEQDDEGGVPFVVPNVSGKSFSAGWADVATVIPWDLYYRTGDVGVLTANYDMMTKLVKYYQSHSKDNLVDVNTYGDWLQPNPEVEGNKRGDTPKDFISTAYYAHSIELTMQAAEVLGKTADAKELKTLFNDVSKAFEAHYLDSNGKLTTPFESQTGYLMALGFNLVSDALKDKVFNNLLIQIAEADNHLRTGFLGTPLLALVLDAYGRSDLMYSILFKETYPSWFYSINQGATTMWERWNSYSHEDGFGDAGMNSFNHYAYGAVGQWMYERIAGIKPTKAGYKEILIAPLPGGPLTSAKATYNSPYGKISSAWNIEGKSFTLNATVPPNTTAKIIIPGNTAKNILLDGKPFAENSNVKLLEKGDSTYELMAQPGSYVFVSELN